VGATLLEYSLPDVVQAAGGGRLVAWQGLPRPHSSTGKPRGSHEARHPDRLDFITMGCMLVPVAVLERVGLIDERYFIYCEDIDYSLRVRRAGLRIGFAADAEVWHKGSASMVPGSAKHDYNMVRSSLLLVGKFYRPLMPLAFLHSAVRCAAPKIVRRQPDRLRAVLRAYRDVAAGWRKPGVPGGAPIEPAGSRS
jgi:GT2 family glycosyltransferase